MSQDIQKKRVLFICTHNSARSQMAEAFLQTLFGERFDVYSAGTHPKGVHPHAIKVMREGGIDISASRSKGIDEFCGMKFDYVITVCDIEKEVCPFFPDGEKYIHKSFEDPSTCKGTDEGKMAIFRRVRDEIREWIENTFGKDSA